MGVGEVEASLQTRSAQGPCDVGIAQDPGYGAAGLGWILRSSPTVRTIGRGQGCLGGWDRVRFVQTGFFASRGQPGRDPRGPQCLQHPVSTERNW